ncbi:MAG: TetR/AcrR family transcriptional regulator [Methanobacteriaceae archaeon]|nr:TetR/AcrR family transcriptional regulator [Methanobacteriaceae archaeon]
MKIQTKEKITQSLITLLQEKEYNEITIKEITNKAEVNRSTYYRNFKSKEDIIIFNLNKIMKEYTNTYKTIKEKNYENYLKIIFETFYNYKEFLLTIYKKEQIYLLQEVLNKHFKNKLNQTENKLKKYHIYYHIGGIYNFIICWLENDMKDTPEKLTKITMQIISKEDKINLKN